LKAVPKKWPASISGTVLEPIPLKVRSLEFVRDEIAAGRAIIE
jgi:hypothetical protein